MKCARGYNKTANKFVQNVEPMPPALAAQFQQKYGAIVDEGITNMKKAIVLRQDYSNAMAYLNLLYRQKADMDVDPADREKGIRIADDLVDQAKAIMQKKFLSKPAAVNFLRVLFVADRGAEFTLGYAH